MQDLLTLEILHALNVALRLLEMPMEVEEWQILMLRVMGESIVLEDTV